MSASYMDRPIFIIPLKQQGAYKFFPQDMVTISEYSQAKRDLEVNKFKRWQNEARLEMVKQNTRIIKAQK